MRQPYDVAIVGAGFAGSLMALCLERIGLTAVLIDQGAGPRFKIGESSTPVANFLLERIAEEFRLPHLRPLATYGDWVREYPELTRGLKRGFSYFQHQQGRPFQSGPAHPRELLVTASQGPDDADTHWLRADFDEQLVQWVCSAGIPYLCQTSIESVEFADLVHLSGKRQHETVELSARFLIDASGDGGFLSRQLQIPSWVDRMHTSSRGLFSHFRQLRPWHQVLPEGATRDYPFPCDCAALHHLIDEGWMWVLQFDGGVASCGFSLDTHRGPLDTTISPEEEWGRLMDAYPSLAEQFSRSMIVDPPGKLLRTGRLQRLSSRIAGANWAMLAHAAGFVDPLHSTGIAQSLCGIYRLVKVFQRDWGTPRMPRSLEEFQQTVHAEFRLMDLLVAGGFRSMRCFPLFVAYSMFYFAAATTCERDLRRGNRSAEQAFLLGDDVRFCEVVQNSFRDLCNLTEEHPSAAAIATFERQVAAAIEPYNHAGLCDSARKNMYPYLHVP